MTADELEANNQRIIDEFIAARPVLSAETKELVRSILNPPRPAPSPPRHDEGAARPAAPSSLLTPPPATKPVGGRRGSA